MTVVFKSNENRIVNKGFTVTFTAVELPPQEFAVNSIMSAFTEIQSLVYVGHAHKNNPKIHNKKVRKNGLFSPPIIIAELDRKFLSDCGGGDDILTKIGFRLIKFKKFFKFQN